MRAYHRAAVSGLAVFAIACKGVEPTQPVPPGPPAQMIRVSGDFQSALAGHELASPIRVRVLDSAGIPVPRQAVNFKVVSGGGSVFAGVALTTDSGYAAERWTLGTSTQEPQRLEARAVNQNTGEALVFATFSATVLPEAAATLAAISGDAQTGTVATALPEPAAVIVKDQYGNPVPGVTVTWLAANGGSVTPATSQTAANGVATTQWTLGTVAGTQGASASAAGIGGGAVGFSAVASPGPLATLTFTQAGPLNLIVKDVAQLQVRAADAYGNSVTPPSVTWSSSTPTVVTAQCTGSSNCEFGQVTAVGPGTAQVTASSGGKSASLTVNAAYGTPSSITVSTTLHYYDSFNPFPWIQQGETGQMSATIKETYFRARSHGPRAIQAWWASRAMAWSRRLRQLLLSVRRS